MSYLELSRRHGVYVSLALVLTAAIAAQQPPRFRSATRLVEVSVVVTDRGGNPITGLQPSDFDVTDARQPQDIVFFEALGKTADAAAAPRLRRGAFTNVPPTGTRSMTVLLLDRTNTSFGGQWFSRRHAERYIDAKPADENVALYVWDGAVRVLQDFTPDAAALRNALDKYGARETHAYVASEEAPPDAGDVSAWIADPTGSMSKFFSQLRAFTTFEAFGHLAAHLRDIAGRKNVVWLSEAFQIPERDGRGEFLARLRRATDKLSDAQAVLYPVDARGLVGAIKDPGRPGVPTSFHSMATVSANTEAMEVLAHQTGGRIFTNNNDLALGIRRASGDAGSGYVIGYYAPDAGDGTFRQIGVSVKRKGAVVRHRSGYYAAPPVGTDQAQRTRAARQALEAPLQASGIGLSADISRSADAASFELTVHVDAAGLSFEREGDSWRAAADVVIAQVDERGRGAISASQPAALVLSDAQRARALAEGITLRHTIRRLPRAHQVRIVVRDVASGRVGSLNVAVDKIARPAGS